MPPREDGDAMLGYGRGGRKEKIRVSLTGGKGKDEEKTDFPRKGRRGGERNGTEAVHLAERGRRTGSSGTAVLN